MQSEFQPPSQHDALARRYEEAYVTHLEAAEGGVDLEDRLNSSLELLAAALQMKAAGLEARMSAIRASYRI